MSTTRAPVMRPAMLTLALLLALAHLALAPGQATADDHLDIGLEIEVATTEDRSAPESCQEDQGYDDCTLREAIEVANNQWDGSTTRIVLPAGEYLLDSPLDVWTNVVIDGAGAETTVIAPNEGGDVAAQEVPGGARLLNFFGSLSVNGLTLDGKGIAGLLGGQPGEYPDLALTTREVILTDGFDNEGGAVLMDGGLSQAPAVLDMVDTEVVGNQAELGGAMLLFGVEATLERTVVADNSAQGGIIVLVDGPLDLLGSMVTDNDYDVLGAVTVTLDEGLEEPPTLEDALSARVIDSTIADNVATGDAPMVVMGMDDGIGALETGGPDPAEMTSGGLMLLGAAGEVVNSTIAGNESPTGAGLWMADTGVRANLTHTTLAGNEPSGLGEDAGATIYMMELPDPRAADSDDVFGAAEVGDSEIVLDHVLLADTDGAHCGGLVDRIVSVGHTLADDATCGLQAEGDREDVDDARLGPLADNGGVTPTMLPAEDSPAVGGGQADECQLDADQRGVSRPQGDACDVGAVEVEYVPDPERPFGCDPDAADQFSDVPRPYVHRDNIGCAADLGFVVGFTDGTYRPQIDMSRGQFATVVARMIEYITDEELPIDDQLTFPDVPAGHVHEDGIRKLVTAGLITGFEDGDFRPGDSLRRGQTASILDAAIVTATGTQLPDGPTAFLDHRGSPHEDAIDRLAQDGILTGFGDGTVRPSQEIQRGQLASMVVRTLVAIEGLQVGTR